MTNRKRFLPCRIVMHHRSKVTEEELLEGLTPFLDEMYYGEGKKPLWIKQFYNPFEKGYEVLITFHKAGHYPDPERTYKYSASTIKYSVKVMKPADQLLKPKQLPLSPMLFGQEKS